MPERYDERIVETPVQALKRGSIMGDRGSGGHNSKGKLRDVQCARLDVHELAREGTKAWLPRSSVREYPIYVRGWARCTAAGA
jgi:hypothetical protein